MKKIVISNISITELDICI